MQKTILSIVKAKWYLRQTSTTADKTIPCSKKLVCVEKLVESEDL